MRNLHNLATLTMAAVHAISEATLDLVMLPEISQRSFFASALGDAAVSALAEVAAAQDDYTRDFLSQLEALAALRAARKSLDELYRLLSVAKSRGYAPPEQVDTLAARVKEAQALVIALSLTVRSTHHARTAS